jgi:hypothetical protein
MAIKTYFAYKNIFVKINYYLLNQERKNNQFKKKKNNYVDKKPFFEKCGKEFLPLPMNEIFEIEKKNLFFFIK